MLERVVMSGPLSKSAYFRLLIEGDWTLEECKRLIDFLAVMQEHAKEDAVADTNS